MLGFLGFSSLVFSHASAADDPHQAINIGSRLELFVDEFLIESKQGVTLRLHRPLAKDVAIVFDKPWEGNTSGYVTVFKDGDRYRMYYRGSHYDLEARKSSSQVTCCAQSLDGKHWTKPDLGVYAHNGSKMNNIVWKGIGAHNFTPFKDTNPACRPEERYKAVGSENEKLYAFVSPDGIQWKLMQAGPILTQGAFDSQNLAFWDHVRKQYLEFHRGWKNGIRDILLSTSDDFRNWTEPQWLDWGDMPPEHLYTNAIVPYSRAPHLLLGFPKRFMPERQHIPHINPGVSDGLFMSSRDAIHWKKWGEAFIRPGLQKERWINRNNMTAWGILPTASDIPGLPDELSLFSSEGYYVQDCRLRRFTLRQDGFVSMQAPLSGGEFVTKPITFSGKELVINFSTSAAGSIRIEIQDEAGKPIPGYSLKDAPETIGDDIECVVAWKNGSDVSKLAGKPVRLKFLIRDADLYSIRFRL